MRLWIICNGLHGLSSLSVDTASAWPTIAGRTEVTDVERRRRTWGWVEHRPSPLIWPRPVVPGGARTAQSPFGLRPAGPDEGEGLAVGVVEQVGVDRSGEARVVELDRKIVAAFIGALRPGGSDLGAADKDPMAGGVVVGPVGLGDDAHALRLDAQGSNLALEFLAGFLEGADVRHVISPWCSSPRPSRPRWRSAGRRRSTMHPSSGRSAAKDGGGETFLSREEWAKPRGRKSIHSRCGTGDRGAAVLWPDQAMRGHVVRALGSPEEKRRINGPHKRPGFVGEGKETLAYGRVTPAFLPGGTQARIARCLMSTGGGRLRVSKCEVAGAARGASAHLWSRAMWRRRTRAQARSRPLPLAIKSRRLPCMLAGGRRSICWRHRLLLSGADSGRAGCDRVRALATSPTRPVAPLAKTVGDVVATQHLSIARDGAPVRQFCAARNVMESFGNRS